MCCNISNIVVYKILFIKWCRSKNLSNLSKGILNYDKQNLGLSLSDKRLNWYYINKFGFLALYVVFSFLDGGLIFLKTNGNLILESWNCLVLSLLQSFAGMVAVLIIWMHGNLTLWREAISLYICSTAPFRVVSRNSLYMLWYPVLLWYLNHIP